MFGQTECSPVTTVLRGEDALRKIGSVGTPMLNVEVRVVDDAMNDVTPGDVGEIVYRGPTVMSEYWNKPAETADAFEGGWFHSGDLVRSDEDGFFWVVDRQEGHDHLGRREHLLRRGGGRARVAPGHRRRHDPRRAGRAVGRGAAGRARAARPGRAADRSRTSPSSAAPGWPDTSARAGSRSSTSCRATPVARCSSATLREKYVPS